MMQYANIDELTGRDCCSDRNKNCMYRECNVCYDKKLLPTLRNQKWKYVGGSGQLSKKVIETKKTVRRSFVFQITVKKKILRK